METKLFTKMICKLADAFRVDPPNEKSLAVYWQYISHISDSDFISICDDIIKTERFFPAISTFLNIKKDLVNRHSDVIIKYDNDGNRI